MLLSEPPRSPLDVNFSLFGIPVRVHPFFWLTGMLLNLGSPDVPSMLIWLAAFFVAILVHEMGHAAAVRAHGQYPWITLHALGGLTSYNPASYGSRLSGSWAKIQVSVAGPLAGFLLAGAILGLLHLTGHALRRTGPLGLVVVPGEPVVSERFSSLIGNLLWASIVWGLFNLLPIYPLDGGQIARETLMALNPRDGLRHSLRLSILLASVLAVVSLAQWRDFYLAAFFGLLAYESYAAMQFYERTPW